MKAEYVGRKAAPRWMQTDKQLGMPEVVKVWRVSGWFRRPRLVWGTGGQLLYDAETGERADVKARRAVVELENARAEARVRADYRRWWGETAFVEGIPEMPERFTMPRKPEPPPNLRYRGGEAPRS